MKLLEERIKKDGHAIGNDILKVDTFLNHKLDIRLMEEMGEEIARLFEAEKPNKILTVESSGIAIAAFASKAMNYIPVVFAKKNKPNTMVDGSYSAEAKSFTKGTTSTLIVSAKMLDKDDRILIVDDFLARGEAGIALCEIAAQAGAKVVGFSAAIEKKYQGGAERLRNLGVPVKDLAVVEKIEDGKVYFE